MNTTKRRNVNTVNTKKVRKSNKFVWSLLAIFVGLIIGWIILVSSGDNPADYYGALFQASFGTAVLFGNFLGTMSWMILIGLSMVVSFRAKLFNIGSVGQMIAGGMTGYLFAAFVDIGRFGVVFSILIPMFVGMLVAWLIGYLKVRFKIHEVISSIMINWSIYYAYKYLTNPQNTGDWMFSGSNPVTILESNSLRMPYMDGTTFNIMFFIAIILVVVFFIMYTKTRWGVKQNIIGNSEGAAKYAGIKVNREMMKTFVISGALAGLAGSAYYLGVQETLPTIGSDIPAEGFNGITIALIAFNSPIGILASSAFVALMYNGRTLVSTVANPYTSDLILGIIIFLTAITNFFIIYRPQDKFYQWMDGDRDKLFNFRKKQSKNTDSQIIKDFEKSNLEAMEKIEVTNTPNKKAKTNKTNNQRSNRGGDK